MSELSPAQRRVARVLFGLPEAHGYALAGGAALIVRRVISRETRDIDAFVDARPGPEPGSVDELANAFVLEATRLGWRVTTARRHRTFCRFSVTGEGEPVEVDLAVDAPALEPPDMVDGLPVLTALDLAARKVLATVDRLEGRDYTDLHALAELVGRDACIAAAREMDRGLATSDVAQAFERASRLVDERLPVPADAAEETRRFFAAWAAELRGGEPGSAHDSRKK